MASVFSVTSRIARTPLFAVAALLSCGFVGAQAAQPSMPPAPPASTDPRLQAAQERLEAAVREVAELSGQGGTGQKRIEMRIQRGDGPGPMAGPMAGPGGPGGMGPMIVRMEGSDLPEGHPPVGARGHRMEGPGAAGLRLAPMSPRLAGYFGAKAGVLVVKAENPALKLEDGDVITSIGGRTPTSPMHALRIIRSYEPGEKVPMQVLRDRKALTIDVSLPAVRREVRSFELRVPRPDAPPAPAPAPHQH